MTFRAFQASRGDYATAYEHKRITGVDQDNQYFHFSREKYFLVYRAHRFIYPTTGTNN